MIDTHCHVLHGLDDGPEDIADARALAGVLVADGVETALCTPHWSRLFPTDHAAAQARLAELSAALAEAGVGLELELAAEVSDAFALSAPLAELERRSIAGRFVLVEVQPDSRAAFLGAVAVRLADAELTAILAHPERSRAVQDQPSLVDEVRRHGALTQVVAPSLIGRWGEGVAEAAWRLVQTGRADLVASDTHGLRRRRCHLREVADLIEERLGPNVREALTSDHPRAVLAGRRPDGH